MRAVREKFSSLSFRNRMLCLLVVCVISHIVLLLGRNMGLITNYVNGVLVVIFINIILAVSLNVTTGFLGALALGHAGFMAVGAYASALFSKSIPLVGVLEFPIAIFVGGIAAALVAVPVCLSALRLRGDYLAIITLAAGEIIRNLLIFLKPTGGAAGLMQIPMHTNMYWAFWLTVLTVVLSFSLLHSRYGRAILAIREDEIASKSFGLSVKKYQFLTFIFSAFFAGVAGSLYAHYIGILQPSNFKLDKSIEILVMVVMGGMGSISGSIISATVLTVLPELLRSFASYRIFVYAIALILIMLFRHNERLHAWVQRRMK